MTGTKNTEVQTAERLHSLDALRGFDMFWIIGGDAAFRLLAEITGWNWARHWAVQLEHVPWQGFHFYDLIFPLFMFISGVAMPYSLLARAESDPRKGRVYLKLARRALLLVLLGLVYNGLLRFDFRNQRYASVLGQIGLAYLLAGLVMRSVKSLRGRLAVLLALLSGYAALQLLVPVPGIGAGVLTPGGTINGYVDRLLLPGKLYGEVFDPEGILCIVSAAGITLMGGIAGSILREGRGRERRNVLILLAAGAGLLALGLVLKRWYPVIKSAWTSSFNVYAGAFCFLLLALFYLVIDVWKWRRWAFFFRVIGLNSITIYMGARLIDFSHSSQFLLGGAARLSGRYGPLVLIAGVIFLEWLFLYFLYKKRIFLRV